VIIYTIASIVKTLLYYLVWSKKMSSLRKRERIIDEQGFWRRRTSAKDGGIMYIHESNFAADETFKDENAVFDGATPDQQKFCKCSNSRVWSIKPGINGKILDELLGSFRTCNLN
jgi:hypothetical protein